MIGTVKIQVKPEEIIEAIKGMEKRKRETFLEDLMQQLLLNILAAFEKQRLIIERKGSRHMKRFSVSEI